MKGQSLMRGSAWTEPSRRRRILHHTQATTEHLRQRNDLLMARGDSTESSCGGARQMRTPSYRELLRGEGQVELTLFAFRRRIYERPVRGESIVNVNGTSRSVERGAVVDDGNQIVGASPTREVTGCTL